MSEIVAVKFRVGTGRDAIYIEDRGDDRWAISNGSSVLNTDGEWEWEPRPSCRDDDFIARCRFSLAEAKRRALEETAKRP